MFSNVWSENTAVFERLMEIHSNSQKLYYGFNNMMQRYKNTCLLGKFEEWTQDSTLLFDGSAMLFDDVSVDKTMCTSL